MRKHWKAIIPFYFEMLLEIVLSGLGLKSLKICFLSCYYPPMIVILAVGPVQRDSNYVKKLTELNTATIYISIKSILRL